MSTIQIASEEWVKNNSIWENITSDTKTIKYGRLYNYYAATDPRNMAPLGWHIPTQYDWDVLIAFCGGMNVAGAKLKETGTEHWTAPNTGTDDYNFKAVGGGSAAWSGVPGKLQEFVLINNTTDFVFAPFVSYPSNNAYGLYNTFSKVTINPAADNQSGWNYRFIKDNDINEGDLIDIDGNLYHAITIGTQIWSQENAAVTHYRNGDLIGNDFSGTVGAVCAYNNDESYVYNIIKIADPTYVKPSLNKRINANIIDGLSISEWEEATTVIGKELSNGRLYNHYAAIDPRGIAPIGWHVPSLIEWQILSDFCGGESVSGGKLKEFGYKHWLEPNTGATDEFNFSMLASGTKYPSGNFDGINTFASYLTPTFNSGLDYYVVNVYNNSEFIQFAGLGADYGLSIRLIKDDNIGVQNVVDIDGNVYDTVTIGTQIWMKQNLAVTHYLNNDLIGNDFSGTVGAVTAYNNDESYVFDDITAPDETHIKPTLNKKIKANSIDGLPEFYPQSLSLSKSGANNSPNPQRFQWFTTKTISRVLLTINCSGISVSINDITYNETTLVGITLPALTDLVILDVLIQTGYDNANAIIIF